MTDLTVQQNQLHHDGFTIVENVFSAVQLEKIVQLINDADSSNNSFKKSTDLFAIRNFLKELPETVPEIFTKEFKELTGKLFGKDFFVVKSIYFDKPAQSNWFVSYHQDLTIAVDQKLPVEGYQNWTVKQKQFAVQPPLDILQQIFTVRIHLDHTNEHNGALKVIPGSHSKGIYRPEDIDWSIEKEHTCTVPRGGIMVMKPLLLHSSSRTSNHQKRRVIHIEFCNAELQDQLQWAERTR